MTTNKAQAREVRPSLLARDDAPRLLQALQDAGYRCLGPVQRDGAIQFDEIRAVSQIPVGYVDDQHPGEYRLSMLDHGRWFGWTTAAQGLKPLLFAPQEPLWSVRHGEDGSLRFEQTLPEVAPTAVIGVRACDLAALALQDAHFLAGAEPDPQYRRRRESLFLVGVDCWRSAATCFCASTGDGPALMKGFDLGLSELDEGFLIWAGSDRGHAVLQTLPLQAASDDQLAQAAAECMDAAAAQHRGLPSHNLRDVLFTNLEHPRWEQVAERCLACGNCTAVCPTCFCHSHDSETALDGSFSEELRQWDSCFSSGHSSLHGHPLRDSVRLRYRQWLTHKLGGWHDQYGRSGCVGCGRCITWCPVGIDLTEEVAAIGGEEVVDD